MIKMKTKVIKFLLACTSQDVLGHLALIAIQGLIKIELKSEPLHRGHLMDGNADNWHELEPMFIGKEQWLVECAKKLLKYGA